MTASANVWTVAGPRDGAWLLANSTALEIERKQLVVTAGNSVADFAVEQRDALRPPVRSLMLAAVAAPFLLTQSATNNHDVPTFERRSERNDDSSHITLVREAVLAYRVLGATFDVPQASPDATIGAVTAAFGATDFDEEGKVIAENAMQDALRLLWSNDFKGNPQIVFSDDGLLTLEWYRDGLGAILLFSGDKSVSIAFRRPGLGYAENGLHAPVDGDLPLELHKVLAQLLENV